MELMFVGRGGMELMFVGKGGMELMLLWGGGNGADVCGEGEWS